MLTINDMLVDCPIEDAVAQAKSTESALHYEDAITQVESIKSGLPFGQYTCTNGWFLKKNFFGKYSGFKAIDICWIYPRKIGHAIVPVIGIIPIPIPLGSTFDIACKLSNGTEIILSNIKSISSIERRLGEKIPTNTVEIFQQLKSLIPWAFFGYSQFLKECWEKDWGKLFLETRNERLAKIQEGLRNGSIIVQPNGSLAVLPTFTLPIIAMKFEKNQKGKLERVYYKREP